MMNSELAAAAATATGSPIDNTATYYVVPVRTGSDATITVWYYQQVEGATTWTKVAADTLNASSEGGNSDQVRLVQPVPQDIVENTNLQTDDLDLSLILYAAVARTLSTVETLPRNYAAGINPTVTVDVAPGTTRALTLVFTRHTTIGEAMPDVTQLMSTNEPEIKNGVGRP
jgi:hypothetical protein